MPTTTPSWFTPERCQCAPKLLGWLLDTGSLTRRLTHLAGGDFSVRPLIEGWQPLRDDECLALDVPCASLGWVREVHLLGSGRPWVFGRSVAVQSALAASDFDLSGLGNRSLGELLFCEQDFIRGAIELCRYPASLLPPDTRADGLWGRRSCFRRGTLAVLVAEIWLPQLLAELDLSRSPSPANCRGE
ncbi:chorismate--pyruvate lyase [Ventosimonas gracilis]|uniref:Probable chorismate pyruvate-lyase n=1 Tax=Ventosimonas gracilis TaxID=1680762 RepID=A0A139SUY1_9GAMM|nr:chorismate lyase [Ventosimonas gracilis]KXU38395.1 chorismate--pyruvate lyase [Ventosimonas gracilis]